MRSVDEIFAFAKKAGLLSYNKTFEIRFCFKYGSQVIRESLTFEYFVSFCTAGTFWYDNDFCQGRYDTYNVINFHLKCLRSPRN